MKNVRFFKNEKLCYAFLCTIAFAAISGVLSSCAKEELDYGKLNLISEPKPVTANATLPKSANVDKTLVDSDGNVIWESSDVITVNGSTLCKSVILSVFFKLFSLVTHCYSSNFN